MIHIEMNTGRLKMTVKGHALPEECGEDYGKICNAVGALAQGMVYAVTRYEEGAALDSMDYRPDSGNLMIRMKAEEGYENRLRGIWDLYGYGLELMAKSHPQSVEMIWDGAKVIPDKEMTNK